MIKPSYINDVSIKRFLSPLIICLLYPYIMVDMLNGYLMSNADFSISQPYKAVTLILICFYLFDKWLLYVCISFVLVYGFSHYTLFENFGVVASGLDWLLKFVSILLYYAFFVDLIKRNESIKIVRFSKISFFSLLINMTIGAFGYGYSQYGAGSSGIGTKGFIYSGNELALAIVTGSALMMMFHLKTSQVKNFYLVSFIFLVMAILSTTKVTIGSVFILFILYYLYFMFEIKHGIRIRKDKASHFSFFFLLSPVILFSAAFFIFNSGVVNRFLYMYDNFDFLTFIYSSRNIWALDALSVFNDYSLLETFFGSGRVWWQAVSFNKSVEIDSIDFLMMYGVVGLSVVIIFFSIIAFRCILSLKENPYSYYILIYIILLFFISNTAGHVIYSGVAGPLIAACLSFSHFKGAAR